jgi:hypothetical protein
MHRWYIATAENKMIGNNGRVQVQRGYITEQESEPVYLYLKAGCRWLHHTGAAVPLHKMHFGCKNDTIYKAVA